MKRIAFTTLGCKANWSDSEALIQVLRGAGFEIVPFGEVADAYVVNTCTVTAYAGAQSRQMLRRAKRRSPDAIVVATGCYGEVSREKLALLEGVDAIFGVHDRDRMVGYLCERLGVEFDESNLEMTPIGLVPVSCQSRARAFVKIQEGCNKRCAYCIIPTARGASRSMTIDDVVKTLSGLSKSHNEIVLAGIDIGQYGRDLGDGTDLKGLLRVVRREEGMSRIRLSTLGPKQIDEELIGIISEGGICRQIHLSIQSGSDGVLSRMRRGYSADDVRRVAELIHGGVPDVAITGDVIAGFPGETEIDHLETMKLLGDLPLAGLHVFPFSRRKGTLAERMSDQVPGEVRKRRAAEIREQAAGQRVRYIEGLVEKSFDVVVTSRRKDDEGMVEGVADIGVKIKLPAASAEYGSLARARIVEVRETEARGIWE